MQLFGARAGESPEDFRRQVAEKRGGQIGFLTYAVLLGRSDGQALGLCGLLYTVGDTVWFEDFERDNWFSRLIGARTRSERTELSFQRSDVAFTRMVSRSSARVCMNGRRAPESLPAVSPLARFLSSTVTQVHLSSGTSLFFEIMMGKEFAALFGEGWQA